MRLGILDTIALAATLVFAVPAAVVGGQLLLDARPLLGTALVVFAVLMVVVPQLTTTPGDLPGAVVKGVVGRALGPAEDGDEE